MMAPSDDRTPLPLGADELRAAKETSDERERLRIHRLLLTECMRRLRSGRTLERAHGVIHPEMTAITRDALRLVDLVFPGSKEKRGELEVDAEPPVVERSPGAVALAALVARSSSAKVVRVAGLPVKRIGALASGEAVPTDAERAALGSRLRIDEGSWPT